MARPKLPNATKRVKMTLTVSPEVKDMAEYIRIKKSISISALIEEVIRKEYRKLAKAGEAPAEQLPGQIKMEDV